MDGARKLIRWDLDQTFQAKVSQHQTDTILDIIKTNPSLVDTGRNLDITALPSITNHLDVYNYACKRFFNQFKAKLMEVKIEEYQAGGKEQLEAEIEQRRTESEAEAKKLEKRKAKLESKAPEDGETKRMKRNKRSLMQTVRLASLFFTKDPRGWPLTSPDFRPLFNVRNDAVSPKNIQVGNGDAWTPCTPCLPQLGR